MCGIIGYVGMKNEAMEVILEGLEKLEYRGYDSAGVALMENGKIFIEKKSGKLANLKKALEGKKDISTLGIGHTRWATHGNPTDENSHPHFSQDRKVAIVHNGIIENYIDLRNSLEQEGVSFASQTDSEVVAHLFSKYYNGDMIETLKKVKSVLRGSYALGIIDVEEPDRLVCTRKESPLIIGLGKNKNFIASDVPAILKHTRDVIFLDNGEMALLEKDKVTVFDQDGNEIKKEIQRVEWDSEQANKKGYPHFMLKEIHEQPEVVKRTLERYTKNEDIYFGEEFEKVDFSKIDNIVIVACGTAYHAGLQGAYFLKKMAGIRADVDVASEFRYSDPFINDKTLAIFVSQSGETLDTLMAMKLAKERGAITLALTNVLGSTISREADIVLYTMAGPEISVASTKAYMAQVVLMYIFATYMGRKNGKIDDEKYLEYIKTISDFSDKIEIALSDKETLRQLAKKVNRCRNGFYIGRGIDEKIAREGSLKMKEVTYIHTEAIAAGELKHGTIALIEPGTLVVAVVTQEDMVEKIVSNIKEIKARGGYVIAITEKEYSQVLEVADDAVFVDNTSRILAPLLTVVPLQLLAYYTAVEKGLDVDKPRNLAKSVTVE
ncbi:Glutamine--fructose-6-phosphate aminotransferase [isomerizing] [Fusobacterium sp. DD29]|uniref:glutamine--fructose-6-phosphate transaminase (isomerizing) n=1 Tax=unclassified Fusobacterium TaxID=2648384 RepID=UPI001B8CDD8A|nr:MULTISPECIES: glutamine--fructose-6-phosphate transaminase (isomerizing) [unclassified Fusobacterium]MBR8702318.1 Glutamine--fructose-6-phosphate aminotransferase [isomerizing] [Fusobacterium sp. DD45]MBR8712134.1 Glutamine--fructose-6-phosphate aminotransferase [isomerizing] [Fusobacterium sp. DD28]MBR8750033.1 Glutamine--fructose-6-phosphate aminotransferase [isomerizing] [Fusobacterium sp. DD29]MBR8752713.1 Glutamine--fructose-6-phosphate aminotransferase [isomerizing] [Fusobacterium sp. 